MKLYILPSGKENVDFSKTIDSFQGIDFEWEKAKSLNDVMAADISGDWLMVMYDDEYIDRKLAAALPEYLLSEFDVLCFFKLESEKTGSLSPRLFASGVKPQAQGLIPDNISELKTTRVLDGWIKPQC